MELWELCHYGLVRPLHYSLMTGVNVNVSDFVSANIVVSVLYTLFKYGSLIQEIFKKSKKKKAGQLGIHFGLIPGSSALCT